MVDARGQSPWRTHAGALLAATGAGLLGLTILLPDWVDVLRSLDRPLNFAPATETMLFALRTTQASVSTSAAKRMLLARSCWPADMPWCGSACGPSEAAPPTDEHVASPR